MDYLCWVDPKPPAMRVKILYNKRSGSVQILKEHNMAENQTRPTGASVVDFLNAVEDERKRRDSFAVLEMMREVTGEEPQMWGPGIVGFGSYHYQYASGREGDSPVVSFSPRKQNLTLYINGGFEGYEALLQRLGRHTTGKVCLYLKKLDDVDQAVLKELVQESVKHVRSGHMG